MQVIGRLALLIMSLTFHSLFHFWQQQQQQRVMRCASIRLEILSSLN
jgi:hypothetical protein